MNLHLPPMRKRQEFHQCEVAEAENVSAQLHSLIQVTVQSNEAVRGLLEMRCLVKGLGKARLECFEQKGTQCNCCLQWASNMAITDSETSIGPGPRIHARGKVRTTRKNQQHRIGRSQRLPRGRTNKEVPGPSRFRKEVAAAETNSKVLTG